MFCPKCGKQINEGAAFCPYCGQTIASANAPQVESNYTSTSRKAFNKKLLLIIPVAIVIIAFIIYKSSSIENDLKGYWSTSYTSDGYTFYNQLCFEKGSSGLNASSIIEVEDENSEIIYSEGNSFSGEVIIDKDTSTILIQNNRMGATMRLHYTKSGNNLSLTLDEYWCNGGDPFIDNYPGSLLRYSKKE